MMGSFPTGNLLFLNLLPGNRVYRHSYIPLFHKQVILPHCTVLELIRQEEGLLTVSGFSSFLSLPHQTLAPERSLSYEGLPEAHVSPNVLVEGGLQDCLGPGSVHLTGWAVISIYQAA